MKNKLGKILSVLTILAIVMVPTVHAANKIQIGEKIDKYGILGDVNGDRKINSTDVLMINKYVAGKRILFKFQKKRADVNQDGKINSHDVLLIMRYIVGADTNQSNKVNVSSIKISGATEMYEGETKKLTATIEPNNATDKQIKWSVSNGKATIDQKGNVTAKSSGTVKITAEAGEETATHKIVIKAKKVQKVQVTKIEIIKSPTNMVYNLNDKLDTKGMKIKVTYNNGKTEEKTTGFTVSPKQLTKTGKQEITVSYSGSTAKYKVEVGKMMSLGKVKITTITGTNDHSGAHENANNSWIVDNFALAKDITSIKIGSNKNYVSSGAMCLYFANEILKQGNNSIINYQVKNEKGEYVSWRTDWVKGNYGGQDLASFEQQMNKICYEIKVGNPVAIPVNDANGNFRYVLACAITKPTQASPTFTANDICVIDPTIGKWARLSDYYQFMENGKIVYRATCLSRTAVTKITMENSKTLNKGGTVTLTPKYVNARGIEVTSKLKEATWTSSNTKVATVDKNGKVTAKGKGTATITAKAKYGNGNVTATCKVTVKENNNKKFRFTYYTGEQTGSGLGPNDFGIDSTLGCYTYKGKVVLAGATNALANNWGVTKKNYIKYFNYYDEVTFTYKNKTYTGIILDSCGVSMNPYYYYGDETNVLDMMFPSAGAASRSGINQKKLTVYYK